MLRDRTTSFQSLMLCKQTMHEYKQSEIITEFYWKFKKTVLEIQKIQDMFIGKYLKLKQLPVARFLS